MTFACPSGSIRNNNFPLNSTYHSWQSFVNIPYFGFGVDVQHSFVAGNSLDVSASAHNYTLVCVTNIV